MDWPKYKKDFFYKEVRPMWFFLLELCILILVVIVVVFSMLYWIPEEKLKTKCLKFLLNINQTTPK